MTDASYKLTQLYKMKKKKPCLYTVYRPMTALVFSGAAKTEYYTNPSCVEDQTLTSLLCIPL